MKEEPSAAADLLYLCKECKECNEKVRLKELFDRL